MRQIECEFESDVLAAVIQVALARMRADAGLREHVKTCEICSDVAAVAGAIECAREETVPDALPDSGLVWWKAQMRARREAVETAGRPITAIRGSSVRMRNGLDGSLYRSDLKLVPGGVEVGMDAAVSSFDVKAFIPYATALIEGHGLLAAGMVAMILVVPVAVYLAVGKE